MSLSPERTQKRLKVLSPNQADQVSLLEPDPPGRRLAPRRGQDMIEFALIFPILLVLVVGAIDLGRAFHTAIVVANAAREGARFAISYGIGWDQTTNKLVLINGGSYITAAVNDEAASGGVTPTSIVISCLPAGICTGGQAVRVTVSALFEPILTEIFGGSGLTMRRAAEMMIPSGGN